MQTMSLLAPILTTQGHHEPWHLDAPHLRSLKRYLCPRTPEDLLYITCHQPVFQQWQWGRPAGTQVLLLLFLRHPGLYPLEVSKHKGFKEKKKKSGGGGVKKKRNREGSQSVSYPKIGPSHFSTSATGMSFLKA